MRGRLCPHGSPSKDSPIPITWVIHVLIPPHLDYCNVLCSTCEWVSLPSLSAVWAEHCWTVSKWIPSVWASLPCTGLLRLLASCRFILKFHALFYALHGSLLFIWPFNPAHPIKTTQVLWPVTSGCPSDLAKAQSTFSVKPVKQTAPPHQTCHLYKVALFSGLWLCWFY